MKNILTISKREFVAYFKSPIAYVYLTTFLVVTNWLFFRGFFVMGQADMRMFFSLMPWIFLFFVPAVSMGKWSEEKKQGTLEILFTLPIREIDIVIAKFIAGLGLIISSLLLTSPIAVTVALVGDADLGPIVGGYLGLIFLGGAYLAIGLVISALTENQIIAFILGVTVSFLFLIVGTPLVTGNNPGMFTQMLGYLGLGMHFDSITRGVIDLRDILYYLSIIGFFLFLNLKALGGRLFKTNTSLIAISIVIVLIAVNFFVSRHSWRLDLTDKKIYTLSKSTRNILKNLDDIITVKVYFTKDLPPALQPLRRDVDDLLSEFKNAAKNKLQIEFIDPASSQMEEQKVAMLGIPPIQLNVLERDKQEVAKIYLGMTVMFEDKQQVIPVVQRTNNLEYELTEALIKVSSEKLPQLAWWGEGQFDLIKQAIGRRYEMSEINDKNISDITPDKFATLILASPRTLSEEALTTLDKYITSGGKIIALIDRFDIGQNLSLTPVETNVVDLFTRYGATVDDTIVLDSSNAMAAFSGGVVTYHISYPFWVDVRHKQFNSSEPLVAELETAVFPWTSPLTFSSEKGTPLAKSSPLSTTISGKDAKLDPQSANTELKNGTHEEKTLVALLNVEENASSKIFIVGSSKWITNNTLQSFPANATLFENALDAFVMGDALIGIRSRDSSSRPIADLSDSARAALKYTNILIGPILLSIIGFILYLIRRARYKAIKLYYEK